MGERFDDHRRVAEVLAHGHRAGHGDDPQASGPSRPHTVRRILEDNSVAWINPRRSEGCEVEIWVGLRPLGVFTGGVPTKERPQTESFADRDDPRTR